MTDTADTPDPQPTPPKGATPRYIQLWRSLIHEDPEAADLIQAAITQETDFDKACDAITAEVLTAISFGLIARARATDFELFQDIAALYIGRTKGLEPTNEVWKYFQTQAIERCDELSEKTFAPTSQLLALQGAVIAADPNNDISTQLVLSYAIEAWDCAVRGQHAAAIFWAIDIVASHTRKSRKDIPNDTRGDASRGQKAASSESDSSQNWTG